LQKTTRFLITLNPHSGRTSLDVEGFNVEDCDSSFFIDVLQHLETSCNHGRKRVEKDTVSLIFNVSDEIASHFVESFLETLDSVAGHLDEKGHEFYDGRKGQEPELFQQLADEDLFVDLMRLQRETLIAILTSEVEPTKEVVECMNRLQKERHEDEDEKEDEKDEDEDEKEDEKDEDKYEKEDAEDFHKSPNWKKVDAINALFKSRDVRYLQSSSLKAGTITIAALRLYLMKGAAFSHLFHYIIRPTYEAVARKLIEMIPDHDFKNFTGIPKGWRHLYGVCRWLLGCSAGGEF
jgi:hypothetical protein